MATSTANESTLVDGGANASNKKGAVPIATFPPSIEGDSSNGGPRVAAALLSLGQDLAKGETVAPTAAASGTSSIPSSSEPTTGRVVTNSSQVHVPLELVPTSNTPVLPKAVPIAGVETENLVSTNHTKKRQRSNSKKKTIENGSPPGFWRWLPLGDKVGNWDVICGRGGESNNFIGNKRYRQVVGERKAEYRKIDVKQRKLKTKFVCDIVQHIKDCGGRFIDVDSKGEYYVVTDEKARKKTSQALRETKELKWFIETENEEDEKKGVDKKNTVSNKDTVCPFCGKKGHKTRIAKACSKHHEWCHVNNTPQRSAVDGDSHNAVTQPRIAPNVFANGANTRSGGMTTSLPLVGDGTLQNKIGVIPAPLQNLGTRVKIEPQYPKNRATV